MFTKREIIIAVAATVATAALWWITNEWLERNAERRIFGDVN
jgi:hypothetical protein